MIKNNQFTFHIKLEPITPIFIGSDKEKDYKKGFDFIYKEGKVYIIDQSKLLNELLRVDKKVFNDYLNKATQNKLLDFFKESFKKDIRQFASKTYEFKDDDAPEIKAFVRDGLGRVFIPGSSLKGSIRSVLLHHFLDKNKFTNQKGDKKNDNEITKSVFGDIENNLMHYLQFSDIYFESTELISTKIFSTNTQKGGWKHERIGSTNEKFKPTGFTTVYEVLKTDQTGVGTLVFLKPVIDLLPKNGKTPPNLDKLKKPNTSDFIQNLFQLVNQFTDQYLKKEIDFFDIYRADYSDVIKDELKKIKSKIPQGTQSNYCILRLGAGSGFHAITGDWQFDTHKIDEIDSQNRNRGKYKGKDSVKTRKIAFKQGGNNVDFFPLGFVKISLTHNPEDKVLRQERVILKFSEKPSPNEPLKKEEIQKQPEIKYYQGKITAGTELMAECIGKDPKNVKMKIFKLFIGEPGKEQTVNLSYNDDAIIGKKVIVKVKGVQKDKVQSIDFKREL